MELSDLSHDPIRGGDTIGDQIRVLKLIYDSWSNKPLNTTYTTIIQSDHYPGTRDETPLREVVLLWGLIGVEDKKTVNLDWMKLKVLVPRHPG